ncbi:MAG: hypothetical protein AB1896_00545 [Thermodesulfobacteriota bacterium]
MVETIAVYWEDRIKTYGFELATGLALVQARWAAGREDRREAPGPTYGLVLAQSFDGATLELTLVMEAQAVSDLEKRPGRLELYEVTAPVDMVHFQGPHFGDRYGIAAAAFAALAEDGLPLLAAGCAGSSIYLVLSEGRGEKARKALDQSFQVPRAQESEK